VERWAGPHGGPRAEEGPRRGAGSEHFCVALVQGRQLWGVPLGQKGALRPLWRPFRLRFTYVASDLVKKC
jgi:hypothetical protein